MLQEATYLKPRAKSSRPPSAVISFLPVPVKAVLDRDLTVADLRVLAFFHFLSHRRRKQGKHEVTVSLSTIAKKTGLSRAQVRESVARLKSKGIITKQEDRKEKVGSYRLSEEKPFVCIPAPVFSLSPSAVKVYAYLRWLQGRKEYAFPYVRTIASDLGLARYSVQRALRSLEAEGWIKVEGKRSRAYKVAARMPFAVEKAVPAETSEDNLPGPNAEATITTQDSTEGVGNQLWPPTSPEEEGGTSRGPSVLPAVAHLCYQLWPRPVAEMQTGTDQASNKTGLSKGFTYETGRMKGDGLGENCFRLGEQANFETPSLGGETAPSNTRPVPQDTSPSAGKAHASLLPRSSGLTVAFGRTYDAQGYAAALRAALADAKARLAALREERARASGHRVEELDVEIKAVEVEVMGYLQRLAEVEGKLGTGPLGSPDDLPATME